MYALHITLHNTDLNLSLTLVRRVILENLDGDNIIGALFPALDHLTKCTAAQKLQNLVRRGHRIQYLDGEMVRGGGVNEEVWLGGFGYGMA